MTDTYRPDSCHFGMVACGVNHRTPVAHDIDAMVARLVAWYARSTDAERRDGRVWYSDAGRELRAESLANGWPELAGIVVAALLSPRADWSYNLPAAIALLRGEEPSGVILPARVAIARAYLASLDASLCDGPKVQPFACNLSGCPDCVTADTWHARASLGAWDVELRSCGCDHAAIAEATRRAAAIVGETPAELQAIVWVAIRNANPKGSRQHQAVA